MSTKVVVISMSTLKVLILFTLFNSVYMYLELDTNQQIPVRLGNECDLRVNNDHEFETCRKKAFEDWLTYDRTQRIRYDCCFQWDIVDCQETSVYALCDRWHYDDGFKSFQQRKKEHIDQNEKYQCSDYPYNGTGCRFPIWAIILIVLAVILLIAGFTAICYFVRRRSRRQREEQREEEQDEK